MSDNDIVTRLRSADKCLDGHICSKCDREVRDDMGCKCVCHDYPWGDAADEIERLRAAYDELAERLRDRADFTDEEYPVPAAQCKCTSLRTFIGGDIYETGSRFTVTTLEEWQSYCSERGL